MKCLKSLIGAAVIALAGLPAAAETLQFELTYTASEANLTPLSEGEAAPDATAILSLDSSFFPDNIGLLLPDQIVGFDLTIHNDDTDDFVYTKDDFNAFYSQWTGIDPALDLTAQQGFFEFTITSLLGPPIDCQLIISEFCGPFECEEAPFPECGPTFCDGQFSEECNLFPCEDQFNENCLILVSANEVVQPSVPTEGPFANSFFFGGEVYELNSFEQIQIAPVPLPASGVLLLGALAGTAAVARKRAQRAKDAA